MNNPGKPGCSGWPGPLCVYIAWPGIGTQSTGLAPTGRNVHHFPLPSSSFTCIPASRSEQHAPPRLTSRCKQDVDRLLNASDEGRPGRLVFLTSVLSISCPQPVTPLSPSFPLFPQPVTPFRPSFPLFLQPVTPFSPSLPCFFSPSPAQTSFYAFPPLHTTAVTADGVAVGRHGGRGRGW